jgi:hypothetical protein
VGSGVRDIDGGHGGEANDDDGCTGTTAARYGCLAMRRRGREGSRGSQWGVAVQCLLGADAKWPESSESRRRPEVDDGVDPHGGDPLGST